MANSQGTCQLRYLQPGLKIQYCTYDGMIPQLGRTVGAEAMWRCLQLIQGTVIDYYMNSFGQLMGSRKDRARLSRVMKEIMSKIFTVSRWRKNVARRHGFIIQPIPPCSTYSYAVSDVVACSYSVSLSRSSCQVVSQIPIAKPCESKSFVEDVTSASSLERTRRQIQPQR